MRTKSWEVDEMDETVVKFRVYGSDLRCAELEAIVDTGATFTKIPESIASELGLQAKYEAEVEDSLREVERLVSAIGERVEGH